MLINFGKIKIHVYFYVIRKSLDIFANLFTLIKCGTNMYFFHIEEMYIYIYRISKLLIPIGQPVSTKGCEKITALINNNKQIHD